MGQGLKSSDQYPYKEKEIWTNTDKWREDSHGKTKAEIGVMQLQMNVHQELPISRSWEEAGWFLPVPSEGTWLSDFQPPVL